MRAAAERPASGVTPGEIERFRAHRASESTKDWQKLHAALPLRVNEFASKLTILQSAASDQTNLEALLRLISQHNHETALSGDQPFGDQATILCWEYWVSYYSQIVDVIDQRLAATPPHSSMQADLELIRAQGLAHLNIAQHLLSAATSATPS